MILPDYWLTRPEAVDDATTQAAFDDLLDASLGAEDCPVIEYSLPQPKWQFLCHVADRRDIALHGSADPSIECFQPRQPSDLTEFGNQLAVYAAADGIWPIFFAVVDRGRVDSIANACIRLRDGSGDTRGPFYVFSVSSSALPTHPWHDGTVYLLPRRAFVEQPPERVGDTSVHIAQLASFQPVQPVARLPVTPEDFPFLAQVRGHHDDRLQEYATAMQTGGPWPAG